MMYIHSFHLRRFGSIGSIDFDIASEGLTLLTGENGAGKTTTFSGLFWIITGVLIKPNASYKPWPHIGMPGEGTAGVCNMTVKQGELKIIRADKFKGTIPGYKIKKSDSLIIELNGKVLNIKGKKAKQDKINSLIGYNIELIKNSILFGQTLKRLIDEDNKTQNKVFDEVFETHFINEAQEKCKEKMGELKKEVSSLTNKLDKLKDDAEENRRIIKSHKEALAQLKEEKEEEIQEIKEDIKSYKKEIRLAKERKLAIPQLKTDLKGTKGSLKNFEKEEEKLTKLEEALNKINPIYFTTLTSINTLEKDITDLKRKTLSKPNTCFNCGGVMGKEEYKAQQGKFIKTLKTLKANLKKAKAKLDTLETGRKGYQKEITSTKQVLTSKVYLTNKLNKLENSLELAKKAKNSIKELKKKIEHKKAYLDKVKNKTFTMDIAPNKVKLKALKAEIKEINKIVNKQTQVIEDYEWLYKGPLSNHGLKAFIFHSLIDTVNSKLYEYSDVLGFLVEFYVKMSGKRKEFKIQIHKDDHVVPYNDLSGGQKQLVNVAIALSMHDMFMDIKPCNILVIDEMFEHLSKGNIEKVMNLIELKSKKYSTYLITHRHDFKPIGAKYMQFKLQSGMTSIV